MMGWTVMETAAQSTISGAATAYLAQATVARTATAGMEWTAMARAASQISGAVTVKSAKVGPRVR